MNSATFSPDGQRIITASHDGTARIWDAATGRAIAALRGHTNRVQSAAFSPDGRRIVTASFDHTARIWDVSRSTTIISLRTVVLAAGLARGIGWRTDTEGADLLMQDAGDDLYAEAVRQLGRMPDDFEIADAVAGLAAPLHLNCYLSPTQLTAKFAGQRASGPPRGETSTVNPAHSKPSPGQMGLVRWWGRWLLLTLVVFAIASIAGLTATGWFVDVTEIEQLFAQAWQR